MDPETLYDTTVDSYTHHINPYLARLMGFAGFGVEVSGEGCILTDHEGREYLDCLGSYGVFALGHRHPRIVQAVKDQLDRMPLSGKVFFNPVQAELARRLAEATGNDLQYTFFSNSGTEAVEAALKFARIATGREKFVATHGGYHGKTLGGLSVTGREKYKAGVGKLVEPVSFVPYGDLDATLNAIDHQTAAVILETIQGEGGVHVAPTGYLPAIRKRCDEAGALLILDEVQTGIGRTGKMFGYQHENVQADLLTLAKALGGGVMPIGATMGTQKVWDAVFSQNPLMHTSTFGGNPLACAAGIATLDVLQQEGLIERAEALGARFMAGVHAAPSSLVAEVRGKGLIIGVEFSMDEVGELVIGQLTKRGVIAAYTLNNPRVIRFEPPLIISESQVDTAIRAFTEALAETESLISALI